MHKFISNIKIEMLEKLKEVDGVLENNNHSFHSYAITGRKRRQIEDDMNNEISKAVHEAHVWLNETYEFDIDRDSYAKLYQRVKYDKSRYFVIAEFYRIKKIDGLNEGLFSSTYERIEKIAELEISVELF